MAPTKGECVGTILISQIGFVESPAYSYYHYLLPGFQNPRGGIDGHIASSDHTALFTVSKKVSRYFQQLIHTRERQVREEWETCN